MKRRFASRSLLPAVCLAALGAAHCAREAPPPPPPPPLVVAAPVVKAGSVREIGLAGTLAAERSIALGFATQGTVEQVFVEEGQAVAQGQILATLAARSYQDALGIAEAKAKQAEDAYRRLLPMHQNQTLPEVKFVEVETGREQADLAVSIARKNLADTELRAPVRGVVEGRHAEPGTSATPGLPAFTIAETATMTAVAPIPETQVGQIRRGVAARVTVQALQRDFAGTVREIAVAANPLTRTYDVKISVPNPGGDLRVGMIADVHLQVAAGTARSETELLAVPPEAVRIDERGRTYLFVVGADKTIARRAVTVERFVGEATALSGGVDEGEIVVTSGTPMLYDGLAVRLAEPEPAQVRR
jgi:membrane fusion protein, multidrug efflux system